MDRDVIRTNELTQQLDQRQLLVDFQTDGLQHHLEPSVCILDLDVTEELPGFENGGDSVQHLLNMRLGKLRFLIQSSHLVNNRLRLSDLRLRADLDDLNRWRLFE